MPKLDIAHFNVGSLVVYPSHGVGQVTNIEDQSIGGMSIQLLVIYFQKEKMSLRVPINKATKAGLRALSTKEAMLDVIKILQSRPKATKGIWSKRATEYEAKINSGDLYLIAEVVRDLYKETNETERSYSERMIYELALSRLSTEYALLYDVDLQTAAAKIVEGLYIRQQMAV